MNAEKEKNIDLLAREKMPYATPRHARDVQTCTKCYQSARIISEFNLITTLCHSCLGSRWNHFQALVWFGRTTLQIR